MGFWSKVSKVGFVENYGLAWVFQDYIWKPKSTLVGIRLLSNGIQHLFMDPSIYETKYVRSFPLLLSYVKGTMYRCGGNCKIFVTWFRRNLRNLFVNRVKHMSSVLIVSKLKLFFLLKYIWLKQEISHFHQIG